MSTTSSKHSSPFFARRRYDRRIAALVWPPVSLIHRQVAIALVRSAVRAQ